MSLIGNRFVVRLFVAFCFTALLYWSQSSFAHLATAVTKSGEFDIGHWLFASAHRFFSSDATAANRLLGLSSFFMDLTVVGLLFRGILSRRGLEVFLALFFVYGVRQPALFMTTQTAPLDAIWHDPGFPSLTVRYNCLHDLALSGHVAVQTVGALALGVGGGWLFLAMWSLVGLQIFTVLALHVHYSQDVFYGLVIGWCGWVVAKRFGRRIELAFARGLNLKRLSFELRALRPPEHSQTEITAQADRILVNDA
jgi:hypothetical protein